MMLQTTLLSGELNGQLRHRPSLLLMLLRLLRMEKKRLVIKYLVQVIMMGQMATESLFSNIRVQLLRQVTTVTSH